MNVQKVTSDAFSLFDVINSDQTYRAHVVVRVLQTLVSVRGCYTLNSFRLH